MYSTESGSPAGSCVLIRRVPQLMTGRITGRIQVRRKLGEPDSAGNTHRITHRLRQSAGKNMPAALAPCENDLLNGTRFALAAR